MEEKDCLLYRIPINVERKKEIESHYEASTRVIIVDKNPLIDTKINMQNFKEKHDLHSLKICPPKTKIAILQWRNLQKLPKKSCSCHLCGKSFKKIVLVCSIEYKREWS